jgi:pyruvate kinase
MKKHDIIATIGHASGSDDVIAAMIDAGMTIARLNFSWDTHEIMRERIAQIRRIASAKGKTIPILQDLSGPRVQEGAEHHYAEGSEDALTDKDLADLAFGIEEHCEYVALSYVGSRGVLDTLRHLLEKKGSLARIVAKIERQEALEHLKEIIDASDVIMVARGDLGDAVPYEEVPFIQHRIIKACIAAGKPVIVATQMLLSMVENDIPTRAEVSDVAYAIVDGATAVMLSEETAKGIHPALAVAAMRRITSGAEKHMK